MELAAVLREEREEAAPVALWLAAELRLDRLLERAELTELMLEPTEDSAELRERAAEAEVCEAPEMTEDRELLVREAAEEAELTAELTELATLEAAGVVEL